MVWRREFLYSVVFFIQFLHIGFGMSPLIIHFILYFFHKYIMYTCHGVNAA